MYKSPHFPCRLQRKVDSNLACITAWEGAISVYTHGLWEKADGVFTALLNRSYASVSFFYIQRNNLTKKSPVIMPIVTEDFNREKYAHVDALLANFQGVFLNQVKCVHFFFLTTAESVCPLCFSFIPPYTAFHLYPPPLFYYFFLPFMQHVPCAVLLPLTSLLMRVCNTVEPRLNETAKFVR